MKKYIFLTIALSFLSFVSELQADEPFAVTLLTSEQILGMESGASKTVVIGQAHKNNGYFFGYDGSSAVSRLFGPSMTVGQTTAETVAKDADYRLILHKTSAGKYSIESAEHAGTYLTNAVKWETKEFGWTALSVSSLAATTDMSSGYNLANLVRFSSTGTKSYLNSQGNIANWGLRDGEGEWSVWCVYEVTGDIPDPTPPEPTPETPDVCKNVPAYRIPCGTFTSANYLTSLQINGAGVLGELNYQPTKPSKKINIYTAQRIVVAPGGEVKVTALVEGDKKTYSVYADLDGDGQFEQQSQDLEATFTVPAETGTMGRIRVRMDKSLLFSPNSDVWGLYYDFPVFFGEATAQRSLTAKVNSANRGTISLNDGEAAESVSGQFEPGEEVTLKAVPAKGYSFFGWKSNRYIFSKDAEITISMTDNKDLIAVFGSANEFTVKIIGLRADEVGGLIVGEDTLQTDDLIECPGNPEEGVDFNVVEVESLNHDVSVSGKNLVLAYFTTDRSKLDDNCHYQLIVARGTVHYKQGDEFLINSKEQDYPAENAEWKIIQKEGEDNAYYFYNVGAEKYLSSGSSYSLTDDPTSTLTINPTNNAKYPFYMKMGSNYVNIGGSKQLVIDSWSTLDDGNQFRFVYLSEDAPVAINGVDANAQRSIINSYNLAGQKVGEDYKGVVISSGKKVLVK